MKKTIGIIRKIDELGRVVIPREMRQALNINKKDPVEINLEGSSIIICKHEEECIFCGQPTKNHEFKGRRICKNCFNEIKNGETDDKKMQ